MRRILLGSRTLPLSRSSADALVVQSTDSLPGALEASLTPCIGAVHSRFTG
ncbi:MAG: hypothetical protein V8T87_12990 [Victivallales bacterium]